MHPVAGNAVEGTEAALAAVRASSRRAKPRGSRSTGRARSSRGAVAKQLRVDPTSLYRPVRKFTKEDSLVKRGLQLHSGR
jgi:hypothetical protein